MKLSKQPKGLQFIADKDNAYGKLYDTMIFRQIGNTVTLNSGGWRTMHTKKCLNLIFKDLKLNVSVFQVQGLWYVQIGTTEIPFEDGMQLNLGA